MKRSERLMKAKLRKTRKSFNTKILRDKTELNPLVDITLLEVDYQL